MAFELTALLGVVGILFLLLVFQGALVPINHGFGWGLGSRDAQQELSVMQGRARRTVANHMEGLALFLPLIIVAQLADISTPMTVWGAGGSDSPFTSFDRRRLRRAGATVVENPTAGHLWPLERPEEAARFFAG